MYPTEDRGPYTVVTIGPELDARTAEAAKAFLRELVESGRHRLVLDLSPLSFIDSSGLSALVAALKAARARGGDVRLAGLTPAVRSIVELTRLHRLFAIYDDVDAATAA